MTDQAYGVIVEMKDQAPILLETENGDHDACIDRVRKMPSAIRWCVVSLKPTRFGNALLFKDFIRMCAAPEEEAAF
ncbi:hypothetical protein [Paracoccus homiensis]|uniref:Uncharacterized protein n=1 Tax=Paracoccus homiensis TaxID=364199 RepID=A0A1I0GZJ5_9RHOB|nr:hypothetical protein [Paracoccus homiensis]SET75963.1 hypothetical protein SAMN04489858_109136 [Paracoccus homiensis]